jgi:hypothetical protein
MSLLQKHKAPKGVAKQRTASQGSSNGSLFSSSPIPVALSFSPAQCHGGNWSIGWYSFQTIPFLTAKMDQF